MEQSDLEETIGKFSGKTGSNDRYTSFDYCYNYFRTNEDPTDELEKSCLVLGFYLASWGMFRGSSFLLQKSVKHFEKTVVYIAEQDRSIWDIDVDSYTDENIQILLKVYNEIKGVLIDDKKSDLVLTTKLMLGVFGNVPAFDNYFTQTFRHIYRGRCAFRTFSMESLKCISSFYRANSMTIDANSERTFTTAFLTGKKTNIKYPKAKIIDMYGFTKSLPTKESN